MKITLELYSGMQTDSATVALSLRKLADWYERQSVDPDNHPMTGICTYHDNTVLVKRDYRKTDCFFIHKQTKP